LRVALKIKKLKFRGLFPKFDFSEKNTKATALFLLERKRVKEVTVRKILEFARAIPGSLDNTLGVLYTKLALAAGKERKELSEEQGAKSHKEEK